ncbi:MAG: alpha/beta hydrolase [Thiothrix sp.]|nr:alpha/beta hydrolase [Thiothrix sp.]HPQ96744.1 alpha/beta hydrolase [Thiolinea sp.]
MPVISDWNDAYANRSHIPDGDTYPSRWTGLARAFRAQCPRLETAIAYGPAEREKLDLFRPAATPKGLFVFIHGGYWMLFDKSVWSHLARGALERGWAVAMPGYTLAPALRIPAITHQVSAAISHAAGLVDGPICLSGHSAGGHLASRMVCTDSTLPPQVQARIRTVLSISGVHDLRPLLKTDMNQTLQLDQATARAESPALLEPLPGKHLTCWVGADERPEFIRQNALLANVWTGLGADTQVVEEAGKHHFSVIEGLGEPDSPLLAMLD